MRPRLGGGRGHWGRSAWIVIPLTPRRPCDTGETRIAWQWVRNGLDALSVG
jgi:hypothetical protein